MIQLLTQITSVVEFWTVKTSGQDPLTTQGYRGLQVLYSTEFFVKSFRRSICFKHSAALFVRRDIFSITQFKN